MIYVFEELYHQPARSTLASATMPISTIPAPFAGKTAIVTGGTRGIGRAIALELARQGCSRIAFTFLKSNPASTIDALKEISPDIVTYAFHADINSDTYGADIVSKALEGLKVSKVDVLVSNAALIDIEAYVPVAQIDKSKFDMYMRTNAWSAFSLATAAYPHMTRATPDDLSSGGRIIFISSGGSKMAFGDPMVGHCFSKAAMDSISRNLAEVYGKDGSMTVNSIGVGVTDTDSLTNADQMYPGYKQMATQMGPQGRMGTSEEVASIVAFVASPAASWMNGVQVPANGGLLRMAQS